MLNIVRAAALLCLLTAPLHAQTIDALSAGTALGGTEQIPMFQTANPAVTTTPSAIKTYANGATNAWTGANTFGTQNSVQSNIVLAGPASGVSGGSLLLNNSGASGASTGALQFANGTWGSGTAVGYFRPNEANKSGIFDVLENGNATGNPGGSWIDVGTDYTVDTTNGEFIMLWKSHSGYGAVAVKGLGTGTARSLVLQPKTGNVTTNGAVGIGTITPNTAYGLDVGGNGDINTSTLYRVGGTAGITKSCLINTANAATGVTLTITGGVVTGTTTC